jgi:hypothetical protein
MKQLVPDDILLESSAATLAAAVDATTTFASLSATT